MNIVFGDLSKLGVTDAEGIDFQVIPEPASSLLAGMGLLPNFGFLRRLF